MTSQPIPEVSLAQYNQLFDRPVIILAAPRSGSTFLFELLSKSEDFYTIGGESHGVIEGISKFNLASGKLVSNVIQAEDLDEDTQLQLLKGFADLLRDSRGNPLPKAQQSTQSVRFLEKTPKNSLRIGMLNKCFPDALFIYLYRDPRENISSIIDAWHSGRFMTYPRLPGRDKPWSLLLPDNWQSQHESSVAETAAFQWQAANKAILQGLDSIEQNRWIALSYSQLLENSEEALKQIARFCQITTKGLDLEQDKKRLSVHTLTPPKKNKWHKNAALIAPLLPQLKPLILQIEEKFPALGKLAQDLKIEPQVVEESRQQIESQIAAAKEATSQPKLATEAKQTIGRNDPCFCHSGKRYKHCHGRLS